MEQKYKEHEIVDGVIRAISPGLVLRSYLESFQDLSLDRLQKILRSHYGVKNTTELYQGQASICQSGKETPQAFLMRALDLRQKILSASQEGEDALKYDAEHIKQLFCRTVETGLQMRISGASSVHTLVTHKLQTKNLYTSLMLQSPLKRKGVANLRGNRK